MYLITFILLVVIVALIRKLIFQKTKIRNIIRSIGVRIEDCPPGKYHVLGRMVIKDGDLETPSSLRRYCTLVHLFGDESKMILLTSHEPPVESEGGFIII